MMEARTSLEIIAPSVDEAIAKGLAELGLTRDQVQVEILDAGARRLFGLGARQARIRLTVIAAPDKTAQPVQPVSAQPDIQIEEELPAEFVELLAAEGAEEIPAKSEAAPQALTDLQSEIALHVAKETVSELLDKMRVDAIVSVQFKDPDDERSKPTLWVDVQGQDLSILIGPRAETLNALQYIASLIISKELGHNIQLVVDVEGFRIRRVQQLQQLARRMADQAVKTGRRQALEPMPAGDRRIVHIELRNHPQVYSESIGEEPYRKVTIVPK